MAAAPKTARYTRPDGTPSWEHTRRLGTPAQYQCTHVFPEGADDPSRMSDDDAKLFVDSLTPVKSEHDGDWASRIWSFVGDKLDAWPHDCSKFGFGAGAKFSIAGIYMLYNEERYKEFEAVPSDGQPFLAFHASNWKNYAAIIKHNFDPQRTKDGWYGNGCYLTSHMIYSQHYIVAGRFKSQDTGFQLPAVGNTIYTLGVMVKPGKSYYVPDMSRRNKDGVKEEEIIDGVKVHYDSHITHVAPTSWSVGMKPLPAKDRANAVADEFVIFEKQRMCPRFLIALRRDA